MTPKYELAYSLFTLSSYVFSIAFASKDSIEELDADNIA